MSAFPSAIERPFVVGGARPSDDGHDAASAVSPAPARAEGVELLGRPGGSGYRRPPSLVRRADGQTVQLSPLLYGLLAVIDGERGDAELADRLGEQAGKHVTADDIRFLIDRKLRPLGLLQEPDGTAPVTAAPSPLLALRMKLVVSNPLTTRRITAPFAWLFHPAIVVPMIAAFAVTAWWVAFEKGLASAAHEMLYRPALILAVIVLTLLSAGFHEIGHAAACRYGGARPGRMGIGLYLLWPAFYTDVTDSYRLGRGGRLRVDLGGLYFNAVWGVAMFGVWALTGADALLLVVGAQLLLMVRQLVPFVRFDGYHILADLVGVPDLFMHIKPTLLGLLPARRRRANGNPLKRWVRVVVTLWVVLVVPLLATFMALMVLALPHVLGTAWASLGRQAHGLAVSWTAADAPTVAARLVSMLLICLPIAGTVYLLVRVVRRTVRKVLRATQGKPVLRAGAALAGALLVATLAWAWWPGNSYRPIRPQDDGVLQLPHLAIPRQQRVAAAAPAARTTPLEPVVASRPARAAANSALPRATGHPQWMVVLLPKRDAPAAARPTVSLPPPAAPGAAVAPPTVTPAALPAKTIVTVVRATHSKGWVFPFAPPPKPGPRDNQALAVNTTDDATALRRGAVARLGHRRRAGRRAKPGVRARELHGLHDRRGCFPGCLRRRLCAGAGRGSTRPSRSRSCRIPTPARRARSRNSSRSRLRAIRVTPLCSRSQRCGPSSNRRARASSSSRSRGSRNS